MKYSFFSFLLIIVNHFSLFAINFEEALLEKKIQILEVKTSGAPGKDLKILIKNKAGKALNLFIPIGTVFSPSDTAFQPRFLSENYHLLLAGHEIAELPVMTVCAAANSKAPVKDLSYFFIPGSNVAFTKLSSFLKQHSGAFSQNDIQSAVWCISDKLRIECIGDTLLKNKLAKITGQSLQPLKFTYKQECIPGQVAFSEKELRIEGLFRYGIDREMTANLGCYDEQGKLIKILRDKLIQKRGQHSFRFDFTLINVRKGTYFIRLMNGATVLNEMKIVV